MILQCQEDQLTLFLGPYDRSRVKIYMSIYVVLRMLF